MSRNNLNINFNLNLLQSQDDVTPATQQIIQSFQDQIASKQKQKASKFCDLVLAHLDDVHASVQSKFYTMMVLVQMTQKNLTKVFFSTLSGHPLLAFLINLVSITDPKKPVNQKGRQLFNDPQYGNQFIRICMQCLKYWGQKFYQTKNSQPTKFKKGLNTLYQKKVVLPTQYIYFKSPPRSASKSNVDNSQNLTKNQRQIPREDAHQINITKPQSSKASKPMIDLMFSKNQIEGLISCLQNAGDAEELQRNILNYHEKFNKDLAKVKDMEVAIFSIDPPDEQLINRYIQISQFLNEQNDTYQTFVPNKGDYQSYKDSILINYQNTFGGDNKEAKNNFNSGNNIKANNLNNDNLSVPPKVQQPKGDNYFKLTASHVIPSQKYSNQRQNNHKEEMPKQSVIKSIFRNMEERSKSPGFKSVKDSLQKEKKMMMTNPPRASRLSPNNVGKSQKSLSKSKTGNFKQSKISSIFANPPNPTVKDKIYEGKLVLQNAQLTNVLYDIKKQQGMRRFKIANFREKNPLFQNDVLQIGFKSQTVYEQVQNFRGVISLQLFIGNKTDSQIRNFKIEYKTDKNQLLYAHPRVVDTIIPAGFQNKHQLMFVPLQIPFKFVVAKIQYDFQGQQFRTTVVLPNSILKFCQYRKMPKSELNNLWDTEHCYRTVPFKLSHFLSPDSLQKWFPNLEQLSRYTQFAEIDSQKDYQLYCGVRIKEIYEGILKINIRPNLKVILQVCNLDRNQQSQKYFKFYLETMEMIMTHTQI